jgi:hypothetical protein
MDNSTVINCVLYYNSPDNYNSGGNFTNCCVTPLPSLGVNNISSPPVFVNLSAGNFRLQTNSPCINAGGNSWIACATDLDGRPRIVGGTVDIGAYEHQGAGIGEFIAWLQQHNLPANGSADYADSDGDGFNNWNEWRAGTIPTDPSSLLKMNTVTNNVSGKVVTWQSVSGITYYLQRGTNLAAPSAFSTIQSNLVGQVGTTTYTDTGAAGPGPFFYRVGVQW